MSRQVFSVAQVNRYAKRLLEADMLLAGLFIEGEISNLNAHGSGHCYFSLKDSAAALSALLFNSHAANLAFAPENGMRVIAFGRLSLYEKTGQYQLYVEFMEPSGTGVLALAFARLTEKLKAEGLFDETRKRPLPVYTRCIAVITSPTGAAIRDIIATVHKRNPSVRLVIAPATVQGDTAPAELIRALAEVNAWGGADIVIIGRGGGAAEDLHAFNDEGLARAVAASRIPVISAVGHETDFTICDFVADVRAATPTAAAQLAVADAGQMYHALRNITADLHELMRDCLTQRYEGARRLLHDAGRLIQEKLVNEQRLLSHKEALLEKLSPYAAFSRGLAYVQGERGNAITAAANVHTGDTLTLHWADGSAAVQVHATQKRGIS